MGHYNALRNLIIGPLLDVEFLTIAFVRRTHKRYPRSSLFIFSATVLNVLISASVLEDKNGVEIILTRRQAFFSDAF